MADQVVDARRRVMGWRAAEQRERDLRKQEGPMDPEAALDAALEIYELMPAASHAPDATREREIAGARAAWQKLRARLTCRPDGTIRR